jgi:hypothetical protein
MILPILSKVEVLENSDLQDDSPLVETLLCNENSLIYASPRFLSLLETVLDAKAFWITISTKNGGVSGALPFVLKSSPLGSVINSLPFYGSHGGPVVPSGSEVVRSALITAYQEYCSNTKNLLTSTLIENPLSPLGPSEKEMLANGALKDSRISQITSIHGLTNETELLVRFDDPRPRNIRKARKLGIKVSTSKSPETMDFLAATHIENMKAVGGLGKPLSFFDALPRFLNDDEWQVHIGKLNGEPVAALLTLRYKKTVEYFTPVIKAEYRSTQALSIIIFEAMLQASAEGFQTWNWGGTWLSQSGVYDFKRKWGATESVYDYYVRIQDQRVFDLTPSQCLNEFPFFYLYPFNS